MGKGVVTDNYLRFIPCLSLTAARGFFVKLKKNNIEQRSTEKTNISTIA